MKEEEKLLNQDELYELEDEDAQLNKYLLFNIDNESYGVEIKFVNEIIGFQKITEIPDLPEYVKGVINLRGHVIPIVDVRIRFHLKPKEYNERTGIIIITVKDTQIGLIVDTVDEIIEILPENIAPPPKFKKGEEKNRFIKGLGKKEEKVIILIDVEKVVYEEDLNKLMEMS